MNPGNLDTQMAEKAENWSSPVFLGVLRRVLLFPSSYGALNQLFANTAPEAEHLTGAYIVPWARIGRALPIAYDEGVQDEGAHVAPASYSQRSCRMVRRADRQVRARRHAVA